MGSLVILILAATGCLCIVGIALADLLSKGKGVKDVPLNQESKYLRKQPHPYIKHAKQPVKGIAQAMYAQVNDERLTRFKVCKKDKDTVIDTSCNTKFKLKCSYIGFEGKPTARVVKGLRVYSGEDELTEGLSTVELELLKDTVAQLTDVLKEKLESTEKAKVRVKLNNIYNVKEEKINV